MHNPPEPSFSVPVSVCWSFLHPLDSPGRSAPELFRSWPFFLHPTAFGHFHQSVRVTPVGPLVAACTRLRKQSLVRLPSSLHRSWMCFQRWGPNSPPHSSLYQCVLEPRNPVPAGLFCPRISCWHQAAASFRPRPLHLPPLFEAVKFLPS